MNKFQLSFLSFFAFFVSIILLLSFASNAVPPSMAKVGNLCVYGNSILKCSGNHSFGKICDTKCINLVYFNKCINFNSSNTTFCGEVTYYNNELELIVSG